MAFETSIRRGHPIIFGLLCLFALIEGSVSAWLVMEYNRHGYPDDSVRDSVRFLVFTSWWTFVFSALYLAFFITDILGWFTSIASHGLWLFITWVFWLAGAGAFTSAVGGGLNCSGSSVQHCNQLAATEAFAWIEWILMTAAFVVVVMIGFTSYRSGDSLRNGLV